MSRSKIPGIAVALVFAFGTSVVGAAAESQSKLMAEAKVSEADAKATALAKVPSGTISSSELEREHGKLIWSFDIASKGSKNITEIQVDAISGKIVSTKMETPRNEAKEAVAETKEAADAKAATEAQTPTVASKVEENTEHAAQNTKRVVSDSWITTKVKSSLLADSITKGFKISVKTRHHVVRLTGTVDTQASADHAGDIARQIKGVISVDTSGLKTGG